MLLLFLFVFQLFLKACIGCFIPETATLNFICDFLYQIRILYLVGVKINACKQLWLHDLLVVDQLVVLLCILHVKHHLLAFIQVLSVRCVDATESFSNATLVIVVQPGVDHVLVRNIDVPSCIFKVYISNVGVGCIQNFLFVL